MSTGPLLPYLGKVGLARGPHNEGTPWMGLPVPDVQSWSAFSVGISHKTEPLLLWIIGGLTVTEVIL